MPASSGPELIYKVLSANIWDARHDADFVPPMPVDLADGYMHFSTADQLAETLERHFAGAKNVAVLAIETRVITASLKWEPSRGGALFPHLYADLPATAIRAQYRLDVPAAGPVNLPESIA